MNIVNITWWNIVDKLMNPTENCSNLSNPFVNGARDCSKKSYPAFGFSSLAFFALVDNAISEL